VYADIPSSGAVIEEQGGTDGPHPGAGPAHPDKPGHAGAPAV